MTPAAPTRAVKLLMPGDRIWLPPSYDCVATVTDLKPYRRGLWEMDIRAESGWKTGMNIRGQVREGNETVLVGAAP